MPRHRRGSPTGSCVGFLSDQWLVLALAALGALSLVAPEAHGATSFRNCGLLNARYPHGVGKPGATDKTKGERVTSFTKDAPLYNSLPKTLDRDKDGIACEKL